MESLRDRTAGSGSRNKRLQHQPGRQDRRNGATSPSSTSYSGSGPGDITAGPDGRLWFTESNAPPAPADRCDHHDGRFSRFPLALSSDPSGITASSSGLLWFTEFGANLIGQISTGGGLTQFPAGSGQPSGIAAGSDGAFWYTETGANKIGRIIIRRNGHQRVRGANTRKPAGRHRRRVPTARSGSRSSSATRSAASRWRRPRPSTSAAGAACNTQGHGQEVQGAEAARAHDQEGEEEAQEGRVPLQDQGQGQGQVDQAEGRGLGTTKIVQVKAGKKRAVRGTRKHFEERKSHASAATFHVPYRRLTLRAPLFRIDAIGWAEDAPLATDGRGKRYEGMRGWWDDGASALARFATSESS